MCYRQTVVVGHRELGSTVALRRSEQCSDDAGMSLKRCFKTPGRSKRAWWLLTELEEPPGSTVEGISSAGSGAFEGTVNAE